MQTRKRFEKSKVIISGDVTTMLKKARQNMHHQLSFLENEYTGGIN